MSTVLPQQWSEYSEEADPPIPKRGLSPRWLDSTLTFVEVVIPAILLGWITITLAINVVARYVFNQPTLLINELATISFGWLVFLSAAGIVRREGHISVDIVLAKLPDRWRRRVWMTSQLVILAVIGYVVVHGFGHVFTGHFTMYPGTGLSRVYVVMAIPVSFTLMGAYTLMAAVDVFRESSNAVTDE